MSRFLFPLLSVASVSGYFITNKRLIYAESNLVDNSCGFDFPRVLRSSFSGETLTLYGVGIRKVTILKFHTYAMGVYLNDNNVKGYGVLTKETASQIISDSKTVVLRLVPVRNTNGSHLRNAFNRLFEETDKEKVKSELVAKQIEAFTTSFPQVLPTGSELLIECSQKSNSLRISFNGKHILNINSEWLVFNLPLLYVDPERNLIPDLIATLKDKTQ